MKSNLGYGLIALGIGSTVLLTVPYMSLLREDAKNSASSTNRVTISQATIPAKTNAYNFTEFGNISSTSHTYTPRSLAVGDFDGDGRQDIVAGYSDGRIVVYQNRMPLTQKTNELETTVEKK